MAEVAVIATDLAELLGSAIALCLLFPRLEMWQAVLVTVFDVVLILAMRDPLRGKPVRLFELLIAILVGLVPPVLALSILNFLHQVLIVLICMLVIISKVEINMKDAFSGFLPSKYLFGQGGIYTCSSTDLPSILVINLFL